MHPETEMSTTDELTRLAELHRSGALTDAEFTQAKTRVLAAQEAGDARLVTAVNRLRRSLDDRWLGGVCGGLARLTGVAAWIWRLLTCMLALWGGAGVIAYVLLWIFVPQDEAPGSRPRQLAA
jgi:phage shock protein PspC (stress-responsive transcriptional regulator)